MAFPWSGVKPGTFVNESNIVPVDAGNLNAVVNTLDEITKAGDDLGLNATTLQGFQKSSFATPSDEGLQRYYSFDEITVDRIVDNSYSKNHITSFPNISFVSGVAGLSASFNGSSAYIQGTYDTVSEHTISAWYKGTDSGSAKRLVALYNSSTSFKSALFINNGKAEYRIKNSSATNYILVGTDINDDKWHLVVGSYDGVTFKIYVDGILIESLTQSFLSTFNNTMRIGASEESTPVTYTSGLIDEVRIYSKTLTDIEIQGLFISKTGAKFSDFENVLLFRNSSKLLSSKEIDYEDAIKIGYQALLNYDGANTGDYPRGRGNIGIGTEALKACVDMEGNLGIGPNTLKVLVDGDSSNYGYNIGIGADAGANITYGSGNTFLGVASAYKMVSGLYNSLLGFGSGTGPEAGLGATYTSNCNTALGFQSMQNLGNSEGKNVAIGFSAIKGALGTAGFTGERNVSIGFNSLYRLSSGSRNVAIGSQAGTESSTSGLSVSSGHGNTLIGAGAGAGITTGSFNTIIGNNLDPSNVPQTVESNPSNKILLADGEGNIGLLATREVVQIGNADTVPKFPNLASSENSRIYLDSSGNAYKESTSVSLASRLAEYTGDGVPEIPDNAAGVTYFQDEWATTDSWGATRCTLSVSGGKLIVTATDTNPVITRTIAVASKLVIMRVKRNNLNATSSTIRTTGTPDTSDSKLYGSNIEHTHAFYFPSTSTSNLTLYPGGLGSTAVAGDTFEIDYIYIGTGAYDSKILSLSGQNHLTNYGLLPVDGPYGKMLRGNGAQYAVADGPVFGTTGTIAFIARRSDGSTIQQIFDNRGQSGNIAGIGVFYFSNGKISFSFYDEAGQTNIIYTSSALDSDYHKLVLTVNSTTAKVYIDGVIDSTTTITALVPSISDAYIGQNRVAGSRLIGDLSIRFDSRVWTDEEVAAWSNDPRAYDSRIASTKPLADSLMQWPSDSGDIYAPVLSFGGASTGITYATQFGKYQIIGDLCYYIAFVSTASKGTATGAARISLPKTSANITGNLSAQSGRLNVINYTGALQNFINANSSLVELQYIPETGTSAALTDTNFANNSSIMVSGFYFIA